MPKAKKSDRSVAAKFNKGKTLAIFIRFDGEVGEKDRAALDRLAKYYDISRANVVRRLIREADRLREDGRKLQAVAE